MRQCLAAVLLLLSFGALPVGAQSAAEHVVTVAVRNAGLAGIPPVTVRYLALGQATANPRIAVILFTGGDGLLQLAPDGTIGNLAQNFLVRSRSEFAEHGFFVAVVDTPDQVRIDSAVRLSPQYVADMVHVIADVRRRSGADKVWLIGTSTGALSVAGLASMLPRASTGNPGRPDGIVLTSTLATIVPDRCRTSVFDADLAAIDVPSFVISHRDDGCPCSPASMTPAVLAALTGTAAKFGRQFVGGSTPISTNPCQALHYHGFLGIEGLVVATIAAWIKEH